MRKILIISILLLLIVSLMIIFKGNVGDKFIKIQTKVQNLKTAEQINTAPAFKVLGKNLYVPWSMDFLPDGNVIFTQRNGVVAIIDDTGNVNNVGTINVKATGESGLQGMVLDPDFKNNSFIYFYYTYANSGENTLNRVSRFKLMDNQLKNEKIIIDNIAGASNHDGGRIKFGPDGFLYITTGDAQVPTKAQDKSSLSGKILRVDKDGNKAPGNPFNSEIYSLGHRNPQGIAWDDQGNLWSTEHGRSGVLSGLDELNQIQLGKNYGWPEIQGTETKNGMQTAVLNSGPDSTWAPASLAYYNNKLYFGGLRGTALYEYDLTKKTLKEYYKNEIGRIRDVAISPDNLLYVSTSNRDGRGSPQDGDDKIIIINPEKL